MLKSSSTKRLLVANLIRFSTPASLALHAAALLARHEGERISNQDIAEALRSSGHHLAKVMQQLVRAGVAHSTRGPAGGFQLTKPATETTLLQVFEAVEGPVGDSECLLGDHVCDGTQCMVGDLIHSVHKQVRQYLADTTLAELGNRFTLVAIDPPS